ncbi:hypothetical protein OAK44_01165 [bacterium]|nr:hypothetical protein [Verrucomicrobiales bacterium]MDB3939504.1 hypothetical protein [Verrucomicrobiales bacterium]MDC0252406.1 hypothetical protein [bacterium]
MDPDFTDLEKRQIAIAEQLISELTRGDTMIELGWEKNEATEGSVYRRTIVLRGDNPFELSFMVDVATFSKDEPEHPELWLEDFEIDDLDLVKDQVPDEIWDEDLGGRIFFCFEETLRCCLEEGEAVQFADERVQKVFQPVFRDIE